MDEVQSSIQHLDDVTKQATVRIPAAKFAAEYNTALGDLIQKVPVKGFRAGKAPRQMVEKMHGERVRVEVTTKLVNESMEKIIKDLGAEVVGTPEIQLTSIEAGKDIEYTAKFFLFPKPEIQNYRGVQVTVSRRAVADAEVDRAIESLQQSKATHRKIDNREVVEGKDVIDASLQTAIAGQEPGPAEPVVVGLGEGRLLPEVESAIIGMKIGETKEVTVTLPDTHPTAELRGKEVRHIIKLNSISEKVLPEPDDVFVKSLGFKELQTILELRMDVRKRLEEGRDRETSEAVREAVLEKLAATNNFAVPEVLIDDEIRNLVVRKGLVDTTKVKESNFAVDQWRAEYREAALKRVKIAVMVDQIALKEELKATTEDVDGYITDVSNSLEIPFETTKKFFMDRSRALGTYLEVTRNKVLAFLEKNAEVQYQDA